MTTHTLTENTVTVGGKKIFYAETGTGPAVVLLHGGGPGASGVSNYSRNIDALAENFRVIVPDLPGYGRSSKGVDGADPFGYLADGIRGLMNELGIGTAHLVGNSYGGACALRLALDTPDRVDKMVLMGPGGIGTTRALPTAGLQHCSPTTAATGPSARSSKRSSANTWCSTALRCRTSSSTPATRRASIPRWSPIRRCAGRRPALRTLWRMDFTRDPRLARLQTPTLVVWGTADKVNRPRGGQMLADTMPNCDLLLAANAGHWVQWERADFFNELSPTPSSRPMRTTFARYATRLRQCPPRLRRRRDRKVRRLAAIRRRRHRHARDEPPPTSMRFRLDDANAGSSFSAVQPRTSSRSVGTSTTTTPSTTSLPE